MEQQTWIQKLPFYIGILVSRSGHLQGGALGDSEGSRVGSGCSVSSLWSTILFDLEEGFSAGFPESVSTLIAHIT